MSVAGNNLPSGIANGTINAYRFVQADSGALGQVSQSMLLAQGTANCRTIGIGPDYSTSNGQALPYSPTGYRSQLTLGATVNAGDRLKSDANGQGVPLANGGVTQQNVGAIALQSGNSGDIIYVMVETYDTTPGDYLS